METTGTNHMAENLLQALSAPGVPIEPPASGAEAQRRPRFKKDEGFHNEVRRRVDEYFRTSGYSERDSWRMYLKSAIIMAWWTVSYVLLVFYATTWWEGILAAGSLVVAMAAIGFNIQHDGGHHAYSRRPWINKLGAMSLDFLGASSYLWHWKHAVFHHTYSNVTGVDTDINAGKVARLSPHQKRYKAHRWQHFYLWPLYGVGTTRWHIYDDFRDAIAGRCGPHKIPRPKGCDLVVFVLGKVVSMGLLIVLPLFFHSWWVVALFYIGVTGGLGIVLSIIFQLAHCVEEADFPMPDPDTQRMENSWAVHQVETTVDFAQRSRFWTWMLGGLNYQIEHHLFPRVCHVHYPAISPIVEQTCKEYGVRYTAHPTFRRGLYSHYRWLFRMGQPVEADKAAV